MDEIADAIIQSNKEIAASNLKIAHAIQTLADVQDNGIRNQYRTIRDSIIELANAIRSLNKD